VRRIEHDRAAGCAHHGKRAHVGDEIVVAEREPALADENLVVACRACLLDDVGHFPRRQELAFLDVDRFTLRRNVHDEVGLATQEGGSLQYVDDRGDFGERTVFVDVGQHRHADLPPHLREDPQALVDPGTAKTAARGPVRLVVRSFEYEGHCEPPRELDELAGGVDDELLALDDAGSGYQEQGLRRTGFETAELHRAPVRPMPPQEARPARAHVQRG
jgi:hypothetical protein